MNRLLLALLGWCAFASPLFAADNELPRPARLEPAVQFWTRVYTEVDTDAGLIHDRDDLAVVYEAVRLDPQGSRRSRVNKVRARKAYYRDILLRLARGERDGLSPAEREVLALWPADVSNQRLHRAARSIRFQLGQSNKFRAGLVRSGAWEPHIRRTLMQMGLPEEIAALPHVESSFNPDAWSRVGAAGIWQFTRPTGRRYMRVDHVVDERMDPFAASVAAARLLEHNYSVTKDWALALTAYNHGLAGIRRAVRTVGSDDIADLVEYYNGRNWGFASRNFYAAFLAAVDVDFHSERYFGDVRRNPPLQTETIELPFYVPIDALVQAFQVERDELRRLNRALRGPIWDGLKRVPRGYELRVPSGPGRAPAAELLTRVQPEQRYYAQIPDKYHRVRRGESLSTIAARYGVSVREMMALNNLRSANFIRAGQRLRLPVEEAERGPLEDEVYTVRRGDTLSGIAARAGVRTSTLLALNDIGDANTIQPGQKLRLRQEVPVAEPEPSDTRTASAGAAAPATSESTGSSQAGTTPAAEAEPADGDTILAAATDEAAPEPEPEPAATDESASEPEPEPAATAESTSEPESAPAADTAPETGEPTVAAAEPAAGAVADQVVLAPGTSLEPEETATEEPVTGESATEEPALAESTRSEVVLTSGETLDDDTEAIDDGAVSGATVVEPAPSLAADPADYSVGSDGTIEIQAAETLGHYAEWLDIRASRLRRINGMRYGKPVVVGHRLKLYFERVDPETFEQRRRTFHELLQARFFEQFRIAGSRTMQVRSGDSLWTLSRRMDNVPVWLLRQYNPDLDFDSLHPGDRVTVPIIERQPNAGERGGAVDVVDNQAAE